MLATGGSFLKAIEFLKQKGPKKIIVAAVISAEYGVKRIHKEYPEI